MIDSLPRYRNHESRQGHNLGHDFSFTSSTGQLLTLFGHRMDAKDTIQGRIDMFTRTQPLSQPANVEIEEFIDYFFVPLDMMYSGMGDFLYQVNEPYSSIIQQVLSNQTPGQLPVLDWSLALEGSLADCFYTYTMPEGQLPPTRLGINVLDEDGGTDYYGFDNYFFSVYRNLFHNYYNPNGLFKVVRDAWDSGIHYVYPADYFQPNVMPLYLMAYNCIYEHFYRLDDREEFDASLYNIDGVLYDQESLHEHFDKRFYSLKYRPRFFDYFTSAKVAPLINSNNMISSAGYTDLTRINNYLSSQNINLRSTDGSDTSNLNNSTGVGPWNITQQFSILNKSFNTSAMRSMFAVEKLLSITNRAKKTYDAQVMAHLGVDVPTDYYHNIQYIGTQKSSIKIGEVVATASTEDSPLGDIAGKGYSVMGDKGVKFTAPCHGVFMAIYSAVPKVRYYAPLEKHAMITDRLSFYQSEFAKLGLQPIFGYEAFAEPKNNYTANTSILGWQMRYDELKKRFNKVSPAFVDTIIRTEDSTEILSDYIQTFNDWHTWTIVERPYQFDQNHDTVGLSRFLANPQMLNGLMAVQYLNSTDWFDTYKDTGYYLFNTQTDEERTSFEWDIAGLFKRDPLLHFAKCDFKIVNKIPDNTLPSLTAL